MTDTSQQPQPPFQEPSVLDYFKSLFRFRGERSAFSDQQSAVSDEQVTVGSQSEVPQFLDQTQGGPSTFDLRPSTEFPWRSLLALLFALIGQNTFEPPPTTSSLGIAFYLAAFALLGWAI